MAASTTVIDRLIVELGLDPKDFTKGTKQAAASVVETEKTTDRAAAGMVSAVRRVTAEFVGLFLTIKSFKDVVGMFTDLNTNVRQLGIDSKNTGESAAHLRDYGNMAEIAGGKAEDAMATIGGLQSSIFSAKEGFGWNDQLTNFARIGVDTGVGQGKMRDFHSILMETAKALQQYSAPDRAQWADKLGLQGGIKNLAVQGPEAVEREWQAQLKIHQTTEADTKAAYNLNRAWDLLKDKMRGITTQILTLVSGPLQKLFGVIGDFLGKHQNDVANGLKDMIAWAQGDGPKKVIDAFTAIGEAAMAAAKFLNVLAHPIDSLNAVGVGGDKGTGKLTAVGQFLHDKAKQADYGLWQNRAERANSIPEGILGNAKLPQDINPDQAAQALALFHQRAGGDTGDPNWNTAVDEFLKRAKPTNSTQATVGQGATPDTRASIAGGKPTADTGSRGGTTTVTTGDIHLYSQSTDAAGIARDIGSELNRKLTVSLADGALS